MSSRKFGLNLVVVLAIAALFTGFWALINRPVSAPAWPAHPAWLREFIKLLGAHIQI